MKFPSSLKFRGGVNAKRVGVNEIGKADILLIQPPIQDFYLTPKRTVPYGLISIASVLRNAGFTVALFDALSTTKSRPLELPEEMAYLRAFYPRPDLSPLGLFYQYRHFGYSYQHIGKIARQVRPFLVGISSLFTPYADQALQTAAVVKKSHPGCRVVLGGHHPTVMPKEVMAHKSVDFVIRGEGECSFLKLAQALRRGDAMDAIPGLGYRSPGGVVSIGEPVEATNLDQLPPPAHDLLKTVHYRRSRHASLTITASRGCPMHCSYCSVGAGSYLAYRRRSIDHVLAEIDSALKLGPVDFIDIEDENLTMDKRWFLSLLEGIRRRWKGEPIELRAMNGLFPPSLNAEIIAAMQSAGFKTLNLSLGSTNAAQLKRFKRADVRTAFDRALTHAQSKGLGAVGYVIAAAPFQNPMDSIEDLLYLAGRRVLAGVSIFYPAPGSYDYDICRDLGILPSKFSLMRSTAFPIAHTTSRVEAVTLLRLGRILNFIKRLIDRCIPLPQPAVAKDYIDIGQDRLAQGIRLLSWFFQDGSIRGISPEGRVYPHRIALPLTLAFNKGLKQRQLKGTL